MSDTPSDPATLVIRRRIRAGHEAEFEALVSEVTGLMARQVGFISNGVIPPPKGGHEYTLVVRFASAAAAQAWEQSPERAAWLERLEGVVERQVSFERQLGMELWLAPPEAASGPPRWKTAVLILCVLFPVAQIVARLLAPMWAGLPWPPLLEALLQTAFVVVLMTYIFMPLGTKLAAGWLGNE